MSDLKDRVNPNKPNVFVQTNAKQLVGAIVSAYSMKRNSADPDAFDVHIIHREDFPFFDEHEGKEYLRSGIKRVWRNDDLQSFTLTRFMPPELMGYQGRAVVVDPDVFAVGDVNELFNRDMEGKALFCRLRGKSHLGKYASSVMLLDCAKLTHWRVEEQFHEMFEFKRDYMDWISLKLEPPESIGLFEDEWNDFDRLTPKTKMLHTTKRYTQPWKTGLPVDFSPVDRIKWFPPYTWVMQLRRKLFGDYGLLGHYKPHPDPNQERFFFGLLRECLEQGHVTEELLRSEMAQNHIRHDALEVLERTPPLDAQPAVAA